MMRAFELLSLAELCQTFRSNVKRCLSEMLRALNRGLNNSLDRVGEVAACCMYSNHFAISKFTSEHLRIGFSSRG